MADTPHLIRKYSSRRLYDVAASRFVTLAELGEIIRRGENVRVVDGRKHDVTRSVLLQILTEHEERGEPLLSSDMLHEIVRLYGNAMRVPFGRYLEDGLGLLRKQRKALNEALPRAFHDVALTTMNHLVEQQATLLKQSREALLSLLGPAPDDARAATVQRSPGTGEDKGA
ncbi:MAG: polyhydroxyalkanoate synthesis repressor PhaR [Nevskiaceae bacterium]|nr:MAG: polyhydroxyalkanoate synthesis repressor PhaR [Nevskiaceae bacterium]TBR72754.1 MAG: polyhydroxyalkanoate synthesis repressor PhaR [Nevskiaceae bacterium]